MRRILERSYSMIDFRTNPGPTSGWGELVGDSALMMAIIDRLLHHGEVFYLRGSSYRLRGKEPVALASKTEGVLSAEKV